MKERILKLWYLILLAGCVVGYLNRDLILNGDTGVLDRLFIVTDTFTGESEELTVVLLSDSCGYAFVSERGDTLVPNRLAKKYKQAGKSLEVQYDYESKITNDCVDGAAITIQSIHEE